MNQQSLTMLMAVLVILPLLYFRFRKMLKPRRLKLRTLWVRPVIMIVAACALLVSAPPQIADASWFAAAAFAGLLGGWYWGTLTRLHLHPEDGTLMSTGSQAGMIVLVLLLVFRMGMRAVVNLEAESLHWNTALLTDVVIVFSALLFSVQGLEIFLRARRMMKARA